MTRNTRVAKKKGEAETKSESRARRRVSKRVSTTRQTGRKQPNSAAESDAQSDHDESDAYVQDDDSDVESLNSDTLDDPDFDASGRKRKRTVGSKNTSPRKSRFFNKSASKSPSKKKRAPAGNDEEEYEEGVEVVGTVVQAPKTGRGTSHLSFLFTANAKYVLSATWSNITKYPEFPEAVTEI